MTFKELQQKGITSNTDMGRGGSSISSDSGYGWIVDHETESGLIRQTKLSYSFHDKLMALYVTILAFYERLQGCGAWIPAIKDISMPWQSFSSASENASVYVWWVGASV